MNLSRSLVAFVLSVTLMLGSVATSVARSEMAGAGVLVLCGGTQTSVLLDPMGNPLPSRHACPHCLAASVAAVLPQLVLTALPAPLAVQTGKSQTVSFPTRPSPTPLARGPPIWT
jgi:hypothetical protein